MTLSHDKNTPEINGHKRQFILKDNTVIYGGSLVAIDATTGKVEPATKKTGTFCIGIAEKRADTSKGDTSITVKTGIFGLFGKSGENISANHIGRDVYVVDEETVTLAPTGSSYAGKLFDVSGDIVWIRI
jgi:hypothetical protein